MKCSSQAILLSSVLGLGIALTLGCGAELEPAPPLTESVQAEIASEDAQVEAEEMQQMSR